MLPYLIRNPSTLADRRLTAGVGHPPNCPRCDSANTKFCYYNNYSLSQPRYFCKGCRRYWTKGGSLRNVPVGGGCRKNRRASKPAGMLTACNRPGSDGESSPNFGCHRLHAAAVRPDLLPDDRMAGSRHSGGGGGMSSAGDSGADIDLALLYTKFVNQRTDFEFDFPPPGAPSLQEVGGSLFDDLPCNIADSDRLMDVRLEEKEDASGLQIPALSGIFPVDAQSTSDYYLPSTRDSTFYFDSGFCLPPPPPPPPSGEIIGNDIFLTGSGAVSIGLPWEQVQISPVGLGTVEEEEEEDPLRHPYPFVNSCNTFSSFASCRAFPET